MMEYRLCDNPWGEEELLAIQKVMDTGMFTMGEQVKTFEALFAQKFSTKHAIMVSSGSAANLLAIAALVYSGRLPRGSEVIVPAVSWSTTYAPLEQFGMKVVFVDIDPDTLNISVESLRKAITSQTRMLLLVNLLGNPNQFDEIFALIEGKNILVMEDNCESFGAEYKGKMLGTLGLVGTFSSFYSHHICTMEGGVVVTENTELYEYMLSLRAHGWTRNLSEGSSIYQKSRDAFFESFHFILPGFNLRPLEMEGAIGIEQLQKMEKIIFQRRENAAYFQKKMKTFPNIRIQKEVGVSSWFGFSIVLTGILGEKRNWLVQKLAEANVEVRPIVAGNFTRNPVIKYMDHSIPYPLTVSDEIHDHGFFIGNHSKCNHEEVDYFAKILNQLCEEAVIK